MSYKTGDEVRVIGGRYSGRPAVISFSPEPGWWVVRFYNGGEQLIEEKLLERVEQ